MFANDIKIAAIVTTLVILLLIAFVIIIVFVANKRQVQNEIKITQLELNYEKELRKVEQEVQEQALTNVSRELHDNIGQLLTFMRIQIEQEKMIDPGIWKVLEPINETLDTSIQQVRALSKSLNSEMLEHNGLLYTIQNEVARLQQVNYISVNWSNDETEPVLTKDQRLMSFRIFQEIINNTLKHSGATSINVSLVGNGKFMMSVKDNGKGFDATTALNGKGGSGLKNIQKRADLAGFKCKIESEIGKGSIFMLEQYA